MCIVNAPRIEIVLVPENQAQREGDEVEDDTLLDAYLIMHLPDGTNVNLKLDGGPFDLDVLAETRSDRLCLVERSGFGVRCR
jgi:hypothetical protein